MELNFGFKNFKEEKLEKYPTIPVLTYIGGNVTKKFQLNKKACNMMQFNITGQLNFGRTDTEELFIANTFGNEKRMKCNIFMDKTFANSNFAKRIELNIGRELRVGDEFLLKTVEQDFGFPVLIISNEAPSTGLYQIDYSNFPDNAFEQISETSNNNDFQFSEIIDDSNFY